MWVKHSQDSMMAPWLRESLNTYCEVCGAELENFYNVDGQCTSRRCSNPNCIAMLANRMDFVRDLVGIEGVGYAKAVQLIKAYHWTRPIQILSILSTKPIVSLGTYLRMQCFEGVDSELDSICQREGYSTLDDVFNHYTGKWAELLKQNEQQLREDLSYVQLKEPPKNKAIVKKPLVIMITGAVSGFSSKESFIEALRQEFGDCFNIVYQKTSRKTGVSVLVADAQQVATKKVADAKAGGIPIMTSVQLITNLVIAQKSILSQQQ